jgi:hypothetical protein
MSARRRGKKIKTSGDRKDSFVLAFYVFWLVENGRTQNSLHLRQKNFRVMGAEVLNFLILWIFGFSRISGRLD